VNSPSRTRFGILSLLAAGTMINYLDRTVLGIAAPSLSKELSLSPAAMGVLFSAFSWSYAAAQIPGGVLLDRWGSKLTYFLSVSIWSVFTLLHGVASNLGSLLGMRLGLGFAEAPCFPTNSRVVATWFPREERARATAVYTVGEYLGLAAFGPLLFWIAAHYGWRALFVAVGTVGLLFSAIWWKCYREPRDGEGSAVSVAPLTFSWAQVRELLSHRQVWGACLGQFGGNSTLVFFLTWFPGYLAGERHMTWIRAGLFSVLPFLAAAVGVMFGGWVSDALLKRTGSANLSRKLPMIVGLLGASVIIAANYASSDAIVIAILSFAFFAQGMTGLGWTLIADIAPLDRMGLTGGIFNFASNLAGILTPLVIGLLVGKTGSFAPALLYVGAVALLGAAGYVFVLGNVERIKS
jgi:MFS transporter, ACS family, D-galactonate transporter